MCIEMVIIPAIQILSNIMEGRFQQGLAVIVSVIKHIKNSALVVTATNQEEISSNTVEKGQGTVPGAVTAPESEDNKYNTIDMQISPS